MSIHTDLDSSILTQLQFELGLLSGRTNNKTWLAALGLPDTAGKDLYTVLVTDRLDSVTFGLSALNTAIGLRATPANVLTQIQAEIGAFSAQTNLKTLLAALGISDVAGKSLYTLLITDRLDNTTYGLSALQTAIAPTRTQSGSQDTTNTLAIVGAAITGTVPFEVEGWLSLHNMVAGDTFLVTEEIRDQDDTTYREVGRTTFYDAQTSPMVWFPAKTCMGWRVQIQRTAGTDRAVTYQFMKRFG